MAWPIRGLVWETWTNGAAGKGNARKLWSSFYLYTIECIYLLSSEPWKGLELPLFFGIYPPAPDDHLDILWHKNAGKSTNIFGPITSQHAPQWRLFCSINCVWELSEGLRFIPQLSWRRSPIIAFICWLRHDLKESHSPSVCLSRL